MKWTKTVVGRRSVFAVEMFDTNHIIVCSRTKTVSIANIRGTSQGMHFQELLKKSRSTHKLEHSGGATGGKDETPKDSEDEDDVFYVYHAELQR